MVRRRCQALVLAHPYVRAHRVLLAGEHYYGAVCQRALTGMARSRGPKGSVCSPV